jgi:hypothetical protein
MESCLNAADAAPVADLPALRVRTRSLGRHREQQRLV